MTIHCRIPESSRPARVVGKDVRVGQVYRLAKGLMTKLPGVDGAFNMLVLDDGECIRTAALDLMALYEHVPGRWELKLSRVGYDDDDRPDGLPVSEHDAAEDAHATSMSEYAAEAIVGPPEGQGKLDMTFPYATNADVADFAFIAQEILEKGRRYQGITLEDLQLLADGETANNLAFSAIAKGIDAALNRRGLVR